MKIILEGCDGTGKTTLAKILADKYNLDICHCTQDDPNDYDFYRQTLRKENVIWDRHTLGELIYPIVFGRKHKIGTEDARLLLHYAKEEHAIVLVLTCDVEELADRLSTRKDNGVAEDNRIIENMIFINTEFKRYAEYFNIPIVDTSKMTLEEIFNLIEKEK